MVHPGSAGDGRSVERSIDGQARERDVVRSLSRAVAGLANAVFAMNHRRLARNQTKREANAFGESGERLGVRRLVPGDLPVAVPDAAFVEAGARDARAGAVDPAPGAEPAAVDIGQCEVREVHIVDAPNRSVGGCLRRLLRGLALAEKHQLEAIPMAGRGAEVAGVIPPLRAILRVVEVIARELVAVSGKRDAVIGGGASRENGEKPQEAPHRSSHCSGTPVVAARRANRLARRATVAGRRGEPAGPAGESRGATGESRGPARVSSRAGGRTVWPGVAQWTRIP